MKSKYEMYSECVSSADPNFSVLTCNKSLVCLSTGVNKDYDWLIIVIAPGRDDPRL